MTKSKTIAEWLEFFRTTDIFPEDVKAEAVAGLTRILNPEEGLYREDIRLVNPDLPLGLSAAFIWRRTDEGFKFWRRVWDRIERASEEEIAV
jgi:hypothetical protein